MLHPSEESSENYCGLTPGVIYSSTDRSFQVPLIFYVNEERGVESIEEVFLIIVFWAVSIVSTSCCCIHVALKLLFPRLLIRRKRCRKYHPCRAFIAHCGYGWRALNVALVAKLRSTVAQLVNGHTGKCTNETAILQMPKHKANQSLHLHIPKANWQTWSKRCRRIQTKAPCGLTSQKR